LKELDASGNPNIKNINHLVNLEVLTANNWSGINNNGIRDLKLLRKIKAYNNPNITEL
jgi:hypothetical protein